MQRLPSIVSPSLAVNRLIVLQPQPLTLPNNNGKVVDIPVPSAQIGSAPLSVRLISASSRLGMVCYSIISVQFYFIYFFCLFIYFIFRKTAKLGLVG